MAETCGHSHHHGPPAANEVARALAEAEIRVTADGDRMTAPRARVLELLLTTGEPMKAYDLIARYGDDGQPAKPPTVYRALEFLERKGLAHRITSISAYVACAGHEGAHAAAFLICDCCGATEEVSTPVARELEGAAQAAGYEISRTTVEAHGKCPECRA